MHALGWSVYVSCWFFVVFSRLDSVRQLLSAHDTHDRNPLLTHICSINDRSDGFMWATTSSCCCNACISSGSNNNSSSTCRCNTRCCCNTCCCNALYRAKITRIQAVILAAASDVVTAAVVIPGSTSTHMKVNVAVTFGQKMAPVWAYFMKLHRRCRPRDEAGQERHAACVAEMARSVVCTPTTVPRL